MAGDRAEVAALARVALDVVDEIAARGLETTEVPRDWLGATLRWGRYEASDSEINPYSRALNRLRPWPDDYTGLLAIVCDHLRDVRAGRCDNDRQLTLGSCAAALRHCAGEDALAAYRRVCHLFDVYHREEAVIDAAHLFAK